MDSSGLSQQASALSFLLSEGYGREFCPSSSKANSKIFSDYNLLIRSGNRHTQNHTSDDDNNDTDGGNEFYQNLPQRTVLLPAVLCGSNVLDLHSGRYGCVPDGRKGLEQTNDTCIGNKVIVLAQVRSIRNHNTHTKGQREECLYTQTRWHIS